MAFCGPFFYSLVPSLASGLLEAEVAVTRGLLRFGDDVWRPRSDVDHTPLSEPGVQSFLGASGHAGSKPDLTAFRN